MYVSKLWAAIFQLEYQSALNRGDTSAEALISLSSALLDVDKLIVEYSLVTLDLNLRGRTKPELMTNLVKTDFIPPAPVPPFVPAPPCTHPRYLQLKELLTSLEEDRVKIQLGSSKAKASYRSQAKAMKECVDAIRTAFGITGTRSKSVGAGDVADH